jgi:hypothetical protein
MEKEFCPYEQALALKELGFDEPCLGYYTGDKMHFVLRPLMLRANELESYVVTAPLYQQAFRWFREKYNLIGLIEPNDNIPVWDVIKIVNIKTGELVWDDTNLRGLKSYEGAELECLIKLIEIVKQK